MADDLQTAIELIKSWRKPEGGHILAELVKANPDDELAWQWLSVCVMPAEQKRYCLNQVLRINPQNEFAKKMLGSLDFQSVFEVSIQQPAPLFSSQPAENPQTKICPFCKSPIFVQATTCPSCGQYCGPGAVSGHIGILLMQLGFLIINLCVLYFLWGLFIK